MLAFVEDLYYISSENNVITKTFLNFAKLESYNEMGEFQVDRELPRI